MPLGIFLVTELPAHNTSMFLFQDNNLSESQWIFTLICALILWKSGLGLLLGTLPQFLTSLSPSEMIMVGYYGSMFSFD